MRPWAEHYASMIAKSGSVCQRSGIAVVSQFESSIDLFRLRVPLVFYDTLVACRSKNSWSARPVIAPRLIFFPVCVSTQPRQQSICATKGSSNCTLTMVDGAPLGHPTDFLELSGCFARQEPREHFLRYLVGQYSALKCRSIKPVDASRFLHPILPLYMAHRIGNPPLRSHQISRS